ncbi:hypothetical protein F5B21DRAFT_502017 [Xylaria acuta]|nr:hypothetical protein F5B21DRAFT_502017 [Xylaria acuta]
MYSNPLNRGPQASNNRRRLGEASQPSSSRPETSQSPEGKEDQGLLRHTRMIEEWANILGPEMAQQTIVFSNDPTVEIHRSPDKKHAEKLTATLTSTGESPDTHQEWGVELRLDEPLPLSERIVRLKIMFDITVMGRGLLRQGQVILDRRNLEEALRKCEEMLAPLASPTWIDSHPEVDTAQEKVDEKDNGADDKIDGKAKGKGKMNKETAEAKNKRHDKTHDMTGGTADGEMDEPDDKKGKQTGGNKKGKKKNKNRKQRVK